MLEILGGEVQLQTGSQVPKRKQSKSLAARGPTALPKNRGTGFEEYYAEPPLAPDEFREEEELYHLSLPFDRRIESCIQRYRARRRMNNERLLLFNRYLSLGGIDCQPRQFNTTADIHDTEGLTSDDIRTMTATDVIPQAASKYSKYYASGNDWMWTVDFVGVVSGFLSVELRDLGSSSEERLILGVDVVDNFLRYILIHDVCPEYNDDVMQARAVCDKAKTELMDCRRAQTVMPGQFNIACVKLFYNELSHKAFNDGLDPLDKIPKNLDAKTIFKTTVALQPRLVGNKAVEMARDVSRIRILRTREMDLEISGSVQPVEDIIQRYSSVGPSQCPVLPAGVVVAKHYSIDEGYANQPRPSVTDLTDRGSEAFFLDCELMSLLCPGTKLRVVAHELNCDLNFISTVKNVHPSFYTFLPQELMMEWKEPRDNEREAPSVDNPEADDEVAQNMADEEKD